MWKQCLIVVLFVNVSCTKQERMVFDGSFKPDEPTGFLSKETYGRLYNQMWRYGNDSNRVDKIDTVGNRVIVQVGALSLHRYDSASYRYEIATDIAFEILWYGFQNEYTRAWDKNWESVILVMNVVSDATQERYFQYTYNLHSWFYHLIRTLTS